MADQPTPPAPTPPAPGAPARPPASSGRVRAEPIPDSPKTAELARREATGFAEDTLDGISRKNEHSRREQLRSVVHYCSLALIVLLTALAGVAVIVWALQYMLPESWGWFRLSASQIDKLQTILLSVAGSTFVVAYGRKVMDKL